MGARMRIAAGLVVLGGALAVGLVLFAGGDGDGPGHLVVVPKVLDYGAVLFGSTHERTILLRNHGSKPVYVVDAQSNCGCVKVRPFTRMVRPGEERELVVALETAGTTPTRLMGKHVEIRSDDPVAAKLDVPVQANIVRPFTVVPEQLYLSDESARGEESTLTASLRPGPAMDVELVGHRVVPPGAVHVEVRPAEVGTELEVRLPARDGPLRANVVLQVRVGGPEFETREMNYTLRVVAD